MRENLAYCSSVQSQLICSCRYVSRGEGGRGLYEENIVVKARLILHFDINKTVLMSDKAQGASTDHMVNVLLSECAWGRLEPGPKWVPVGRLATDRSPCASPIAWPSNSCCVWLNVVPLTAKLPVPALRPTPFTPERMHPRMRF